MNAGEMDRLVTILRPAGADDGLAEVDGVLAPFLTDIWAAKRDASDGERLKAAELGAALTARFRVWWSPEAATINGRDRLLCEGVTYDIGGVKEIGTRDGLEITASARTDQG